MAKANYKPAWALAIAQAREAKNLSQTELARALYVSQSAVTDWERGKNKPRTSHWEKIGEILSIDLSRILLEDARVPVGPVPSMLNPGKTFIELPEIDKFSSLVSSLVISMAEEGIELPPEELALTAHMVWLLSQDPFGDPRLFEARIAERIKIEVERRKLPDRSTGNTT